MKISESKRSPLVTIIAISYNHEKYLVDTLDSIKKQTFPNIQLIIIDDCSTDNSASLIDHWVKRNNVKCVVIIHEQNKRLPATINEALKLSEGTYLQIIACDDILDESKIQRHVDILEKTTDDIALVCSNFSEIDSTGKIINEAFFSKNFKFPEDPFVSIMLGNSEQNITIHSPTVLYKRNIFEDIGDYREDILQEDFYMFLNITNKYNVIYEPSISVKYRILESSVSRNDLYSSQLIEGWIIVATEFIKKTSSNNKRVEALFITIKQCIINLCSCNEFLKAYKLLDNYNILEYDDKEIRKLINYLNDRLRAVYKSDLLLSKKFYKLGIKNNSKVLNFFIRFSIPPILYKIVVVIHEKLQCYGLRLCSLI